MVRKLIYKRSWFWLVGILFLVLLLRLPSWFEPFWYGDEGITMTVGQVWKSGGVIYRDIQDNKPPLLYWIAGLSGNLMAFKLVLMGWMLGTVALFWKLAKKIWEIGEIGERKILHSKIIGIREIGVIVSTLVFAVMSSIPLWEGNLANGEIFMVGPVIGAMVLLMGEIREIGDIRRRSNRSPLWITLAGFLFGVGFLFKHPAAVDMLVAILLIGYMGNKGDRVDKVDIAKSVIMILLGFVVPLLLVAGAFWWQGAFEAFVQSVFLNNFVYVSSWEPISAWGGTGAFGGNLWERVMFLLIAVGGLWWWRKKISIELLFVSVWFVFSLFGATLSGRPYPHYLLQVVPSFSLLVGLGVRGIREIREIGGIRGIKILRSKIWKIGIGGGLFLLFVGAYLRMGFWRYPVVDYYVNFATYIVGLRTQDEYWQWFDDRVIRSYEIAAWLKGNTNEDDRVFIWGNEPQIYVLADRLPGTRYVIAYHVVDFGVKSETAKQLEENKPEVIVKMEDLDYEYEELDEILSRDYQWVDTVDDARIYKLADSL